MPQPSTDALSPFVRTLGADVESAARALLGVGDEVGIVARRREAPAVEIALTTPEGLLELDLAPAVEGRRAWVTTPALQLSYRKLRDGTSPFERAGSKERLEAIADRVRQAPPGALDALQAAIDQRARFAEVDDWMYRQISASDEGYYGLVRLGFRCNQDCAFCWQGRHWPAPPEALYATWIDELAALGVPLVTFSGGEPTLYRGLPKLVERAVGHGMRVEIQTNAIQLRRRALADRLAAAGVACLFVSYHAGEADLSDALTRAPGTWERTVQGISTALEAGLSVQLNCVVERRNLHHLRDHARDVVDRFVRPGWKLGRVTYSHPCEMYERELWAETIAPLDEAGPRLIEATRILRAAGVPVNVVGSGCSFPPCVFRDAPELIALEAPGRFDEMDRAGRFFPPACQGCSARGGCLGVRREYHAIFGERGIRAL